jgi:TonB family protein
MNVSANFAGGILLAATIVPMQSFADVDRQMTSSYCASIRVELKMHLRNRFDTPNGRVYVDIRPDRLLGQKVVDASRRTGLTGSLYMGVVVNRNGRLLDYRVLEASEQPQLDAEALSIFRTGEWSAARLDGKTVDACSVYHVVFKLAD